MNAEKIAKGYICLDNAILKIDMLLRKYPIVTRIELAKNARLTLEQASRLIHDGLNETMENSEADIVDDNNSELNKPDNGLDTGDAGINIEDEKNTSITQGE